jgi:hypothetical protein
MARVAPITLVAVDGALTRQAAYGRQPCRRQSASIMLRLTAIDVIMKSLIHFICKSDVEAERCSRDMSGRSQSSAADAEACKTWLQCFNSVLFH